MPPIELSNDTLRVVLDPDNGCAITALELLHEHQWHPVLRPSGDGEGSFVMVPWTNRIQDAQFQFGGQTHQLSPNHPDGSAIHGVGRDHAWGILDRSPYSVRCVIDSRSIEDVNFPYSFGAVIRVEIGAHRVEVDLDLTNLGDTPMPGGVGHHPYFMRSLWAEGDDLRVRAGVSGRYPCKDQIPTGATMVDDDVCRGLRDGGVIGNPGLDDVFGGFDGTAELVWDKSGVRCVMECTEAFGHLVVFTPRDGNAESDPPLPWVCVEPVTMVNNGLNSSDPSAGVRAIEPNQTLSTRMVLSFDCGIDHAAER